MPWGWGSIFCRYEFSTFIFFGVKNFEPFPILAMESIEVKTALRNFFIDEEPTQLSGVISHPLRRIDGWFSNIKNT